MSAYLTKDTEDKEAQRESVQQRCHSLWELLLTVHNF